jgi:hypothetical protein
MPSTPGTHTPCMCPFLSPSLHPHPPQILYVDDEAPLQPGTPAFEDLKTIRAADKFYC